MDVKLIAYTGAPEKIATAAGKTCYSATPADQILSALSESDPAHFISNVLASGHTAVLEHVSFTFSLSGVSRSLMAQLTRHRVASFCVQSQRYVDLSDPSYVVPHAIRNHPAACRIFDDLTDQATRAYQDLYHYLLSARMRELYPHGIPGCAESPDKHKSPKYLHLSLHAASQVHPDETVRRSFARQYTAAKKYAQENARAVLPNATATNIAVTMNARELLHFFSLRCCNRAQDEIRDVADRMLALCQSVAPHIFAQAGSGCVSGQCPEGRMTCGHPRTCKEMQP